ncbi:MAG: hypothetical protein AB7Q97_25925 [Gammaproteobacteria bacterium]
MTPPQARLRIRLWRILTAIADWLDASALRRAALALSAVAAIGVMAWAVTVRLPMVAQSNDQTARLAEADAHVDDLRRAVRAAQRENVEGKLRVAQARVVADYPGAATWLQGVGARAAQLGFSMRYVIGEERSPPGRAEVVEVPIEIELERPAADPHAHAAALRLVEEALLRGRAGELAGVDAEGRGDGLLRLRLAYVLWLRASGAFGTPGAAAAIVDAAAGTGAGALLP